MSAACYHTVAKLKGALSNEELYALLARAREVLPDFHALPEKNGNSAEFDSKGSLNGLSLPAGIHIENVPYVSGTFKPKTGPVEELARIAHQGSTIIEKLGSLEVLYSFKARGFEGAKEFDECGIWFWREKLWFKYSSQIESPKLRKELFLKLIGEIGLPMQVSEDARGYYLSHVQNGLVRVSSAGPLNENARHFSCEIIGGDVAAVVPFVKAVLESASVIFEITWFVIPGEGKKLGMDLILAQNFPCEKFDINMCYHLDSLEVLKELTKVKIRRGYFATDAARFTHDDEHATLKVRTNPKGHTVFADIKRGTLPELNEKLGVTMVPYD